MDPIRSLVRRRFPWLAAVLAAGCVVGGQASLAVAQVTTERVSVDSSGTEGDDDTLDGWISISADGRVVAFASVARNLVGGDTNHAADVFVRDRSTGGTERVSVDSSGAQGNGDSWQPTLSADGTIVVFYSHSTNLVVGDGNNTADIFVHDRTTGLTERVNVRSSGLEANGPSFRPTLSADGLVVAFESDATNLVNGDTNGVTDVFVHDRVGGKTSRVSVDSSGNQADLTSRQPSLDADGTVVAFYSYATNLVAGDDNHAYDVFVRDRVANTTERVSLDSGGTQGDAGSDSPSLSADATRVAFASLAGNLVAGDTNASRDVFLHDRSTGVTERMSVDSGGAQANDDSSEPKLSADGRIVAFTSVASNLVANDTNARSDVLVRDSSSGVTVRVSVGVTGSEGNGASEAPSISSDGTSVAFESRADDLVAADQNGVADAFVRDRGTTDATWANYGAGFPGTNGVPAFTARGDPVLGTTLMLDLANSSGAWTVGLLLVGVQQTSLHSALGGDLLVVPLVTSVVGIPPTGAWFIGALPPDDLWCGVTIDLQAIERDAGAAKGASFTAGLELVLGH